VILVTGATGNIGSELVAALAQAGEYVRALTRDGKAVTGAESVTGDLNKPESLRDALSGVRGMFLLPGYEGMTETLAVAREAGVEHVVLLSGNSAASGDLSNAVSRYMIESETAVRESGLAWTIVRPFGFMSNTLQWIPQLRAGDVVRAPFADVPIAMIDPYDIAAAAAVAFTSPGHEGEVYAVTGPEALRPQDRVRVLGAVLDRELEFQAQPDDEARAEMSAAMPSAYVDAFFSFYADGTLDESTPLPTIAGLTGRAPRTFERWVRTHVRAFADLLISLPSCARLRGGVPERIRTWRTCG
jgi:uncharacterized protein YbjT (DUF2867 family)